MKSVFLLTERSGWNSKFMINHFASCNWYTLNNLQLSHGWKNRTKWLPTQEYFLHLNCVFLLDLCWVENSCDTCLLSQIRDKWENSTSLQIVGANSTISLGITPWNHPYNHLQMTSRNQQLTSFSWYEQVLAMEEAIPSVCEIEYASLLWLLCCKSLFPTTPVFLST